MPSDTLKSLAKRAGVSLATAERYWNQAKESVKGKFSKISENGGGWNYVMGIVMKRLGLAKEDMVLSGWPIRLVIEAAAATKEMEDQKDCVFSIEEVPNEQRPALLRQLKDSGHPIVWKLLEGQVLLIPGLDEEQFKGIENVLQTYSVLAKEESLVDPLLVSLFLLEFYNKMELKGESRIVLEDGKVDASALMQEVTLLEGDSSYKSWLQLMFPHVAPELFDFLAD